MKAFTKRWPGLVACVGLAVAATAVSRVIPVLSAPICGIILGVLASVFLRRDGESTVIKRLAPGTEVAGKQLLQVAVVLLGTQLSLTQVARTGLSSLPVMLGTLAACLTAAVVIGRALRIGMDLRTLIGVGTGICGASAIAAITPVIDAAEADVAYAVSTIFLFNIAAVLTFPLIGHALGLSQASFGLFAGTAVNDTSSVVAAATSYGALATRHAVVVKLTRTLLIIPVSLTLAARSGHGVSRTRLVPWFLVGFLLASAADTIGLVPAGARTAFSDLSVFLITVALAGIGLSTNPRGLRHAGPRPLMLGACLWVVVSVTSLALQAAFGLG